MFSGGIPGRNGLEFTESLMKNLTDLIFSTMYPSNLLGKKTGKECPEI